MEIANKVDLVVLLSGDGDFDLLLQKISQEYSVRTQVYGVEPLTANSLINAATQFIKIDESLLM